MRTRRTASAARFAAGAAMAATLALGGCASSLADGSEEAAPREGTMTIEAGSFGPKLTVAPGASVTVENDDVTVHSIEGDGVKVADVPPGETATFTAPQEEGVYPFTCGHHPQMAGALLVAETLPSTPPPSFTETPRW